MKYEEWAILEDIQVRGEYILLSFHSPMIAKEAQPGQFVNVRVVEALDPLLRRPVSIADCRREKGEIKLLVQIRGKGTALLAQRYRHDRVSLVGPLGRGFPLVNKEVILVGGGVGVAPFVWLQRHYPSSQLVMGFRSEAFIPPLDWFDQSRVVIVTDDGSRGKKGNILTALEEMDLSQKVIFACGPHKMLSAIASFLEKRNFGGDAYFSTESMMACGFGACKGCVIPRKDETYALCCSDGPVFHWKEIAWEK
ncbi:dihydroorotate dehydrogenase electron transfer subunit [Thermospira aquatica]|uniref:Dihydroorotate dehydrogenase electron transfer subunit n=1 Tax=Thermospira aquatica TaxID=2828656 RepID=A0AAX3BCN1_9SPIR|nr:dihydroorotate dehydrogenase electron transfer subunit [Thermospira aquatica]URA10002.1 dihydroorotate dehydrogenase electron transfer subunit [Thermospira aquatica]